MQWNAILILFGVKQPLSCGLINSKTILKTELRNVYTRKGLSFDQVKDDWKIRE